MRRGLSIDPQIDPHVAAFFKFIMKWLIIANIVLGTFTLVNLYIYPRYIYEAPVPILHSPHVDTLHPYEV